MPTTYAYPTYTINGWGANVADDYGCLWFVQPGTDITYGPGVRLRTSPRPYSAGTYRANSFRDSRNITLTGSVQCPDRVTMTAARNRFLGIWPDGGQQTLTVDDGISPKQIAVELAAVPKFDVWEDATGADWQIQLLAADPRFLDTTVQNASTTLPTPGASGLSWPLNWSAGGGLNWGTVASNGSTTLTNAGNAPAWPTFTLAGPLVAPFFTDGSTGRLLAYSGNVLVGESLTIVTDPAKRAVTYSDGADRFTFMTSAQWFPIPPKSSITVAFGASSGTGTLSAAWSNASW